MSHKNNELNSNMHKWKFVEEHSISYGMIGLPDGWNEALVVCSASPKSQGDWKQVSLVVPNDIPETGDYFSATGFNNITVVAWCTPIGIGLDTGQTSGINYFWVYYR